MNDPKKMTDSWRDELNFLLTNRIPRHASTLAFRRISRWRNPHFARAAIALWQRLGGLDLSEAKPARYASIHECFTRELVAGARPIDRDALVLASPCDAIVGQCGAVEGTRVFQAKGYPYDIGELFGDAARAAPWRDGCYATLRLTAAMYHRFHAPLDGRVEHVTYLSGDTWNVNPPALARVARLYCRNERAAIRIAVGETGDARGLHAIALVPVAAILVASIRLHAIDTRLHIRYAGPNEIACAAEVGKGEELGWFEHGSTIIVFAPRGYALAGGIVPGARIRMGEALMRREPA